MSTNYLPAYSDSDSDPGSDQNAKEVQGVSSTNVVNLDVSDDSNRIEKSALLSKWTNSDDSSSNSDNESTRGSDHITRPSKSLAEKSVGKPNSLSKLLDAVKERPSFLQAKIITNYIPIESVKKHHYDDVKKAVEVVTKKDVNQEPSALTSTTSGSIDQIRLDKSKAQNEAKRRQAEKDRESAKVCYSYLNSFNGLSKHTAISGKGKATEAKRPIWNWF